MTTLRGTIKSIVHGLFSMEPLHALIIAVLILYIAVCFGRIAAKNGRSPVLWGILSIISPINLIILGYWAFSGRKQKRKGPAKKKGRK